MKELIVVAGALFIGVVLLSRFPVGAKPLPFGNLDDYSNTNLESMLKNKYIGLPSTVLENDLFLNGMIVAVRDLSLETLKEYAPKRALEYNIPVIVDVFRKDRNRPWYATDPHMIATITDPANGKLIDVVVYA